MIDVLLLAGHEYTDQVNLVTYLLKSWIGFISQYSVELGISVTVANFVFPTSCFYELWVGVHELNWQMIFLKI